MKKIYLYSARDTSTGKLVSDITNPGKKYWQRKEAAEEIYEKLVEQATRRNVEIEKRKEAIDFFL